MTAKTLPILLMIGAIFCFASMDATAKYLMKEIGPAQTIWARYTVQAILVTVLILPKINIYGKTKYPKLQFLRSVALMMATTLFFFAFSKLGLAEASAIFNISPVLITLGFFIFAGTNWSEACDRYCGFLVGCFNYYKARKWCLYCLCSFTIGCCNILFNL